MNASKLEALLATRLLVAGQFGAAVASPRMEVLDNQSVSRPLLVVASLPVGSKLAAG